MVAQKLSSWLSTYFTTSNDQYKNIQPAGRFKDIVDRERKRAERGNYGFSLLVFWVKEPEKRDIIFESMDQIIGRRLRATDVAGFIGRNRIGILLWDCNNATAHKVAKKYSSECPVLIHCCYDVYEYPLNYKDSILSDSDDNDHHPDHPDRKPEEEPARQEQELEQLSEVSNCIQECTGDKPNLNQLMFQRPMPVWKRAIDFTGAAIGLLILSPLLIATAVLIKITAPGPVFFTQKRTGFGGRIFNMYKFRTMVVDAEAQKAKLRHLSEQDGPAFKMTHDPRITSLGRYLRKTCIDELPQLINVLKGDMSLVGPRPLPVDEAAQITGWQNRRLDITPGLTCIWQLDGKSAVSFTEWMRMDIRYIRARNFFQDITLIFRTVMAVILHKASN